MSHHEQHRSAIRHAHPPFGTGAFGRRAEGFARWFGTPGFIVGQTIVVAAWIATNAVAITMRWDPYPFILLNLAFSLQAAYAAPLILLAQTRQADRDKAISHADAVHREQLATTTLEHQQRLHAQGTAIHEALTGIDRRLRQIELTITSSAP